MSSRGKASHGKTQRGDTGRTSRQIHVALGTSLGKNQGGLNTSVNKEVAMPCEDAPCNRALPAELVVKQPLCDVTEECVSFERGETMSVLRQRRPLLTQSHQFNNISEFQGG